MKKKKPLTLPEKAAQHIEYAAVKEYDNEALDILVASHHPDELRKLVAMHGKPKFSMLCLLNIRIKQLVFEEFRKNTHFPDIAAKARLSERTVKRYFVEFVAGFLANILGWTIWTFLSGEMFLNIIFFEAVN